MNYSFLIHFALLHFYMHLIILLYNGYDAPIHVEDSVRKSYNILEKIMYTMIEDISSDNLYLDYIIGGNYV